MNNQNNDKRSFIDKVFEKSFQTLFSSKPVTVTSGLTPRPQFPINYDAKPDAQSLYMNRNLGPSDMFKKPQVGEVTVYNPNPAQTDSRPREMASGKNIYEGAMATGNRQIPFGTQIHFPDMNKTFTVEDRMNKRYDTPDKHYFDIATSTADSKAKYMAKQFGRQKQRFIILDSKDSQPPIVPLQ